MKEKAGGEPPIEALMIQGKEFFSLAQYPAARTRFESALKLATASHQNDWASRATSNIGGCQYAMHEYQAALNSYFDARRIAESAADTGAVAVLDANIASLYSQMGEVDSAIQWMQSAMDQITGKLRSNLPEMQIQMASLVAQQQYRRAVSRQPEQAGALRWLPLFRRGIDGAYRAKNHALYATGWNRLGEVLLRQNDLPKAERAFLEAYRVRKLDRLPLDSSYVELGELRLAQGDLTSASTLLDRAVALTTGPQGPMPRWHIFDARGRVRLAQGRLREAIDDFRIAVRLARADRWSAAASDATRLGYATILEQVHSDLIEAGNRLYFETHDPALIRETFEAAEENRAESLRQLVKDPASQPTSMPPAYWEAISRLQRAEIAALRHKDPRTQAAVSATRAEIVRIEASLAPDAQPMPDHLLDRARATLRPDMALVTFHLGKSISWLWAIDQDGIMLYALPPRAEIEAQARTATVGIRDDIEGASESGARLYSTLFGLLASRFQEKTQWVLALDGMLFDVPIAALTATNQPRPGYLVEQHAIDVIPGAGYWVEAMSRRDTGMSPVFVGIGDPIYNSADPRASRHPERAKVVQSSGIRLFAGSAAAGDVPLELPRLVGSASELDRCSLAWKGEHVLLEGANASRQNLMEQLRRNPAVVHFATHFLESSQQPSYGLIALGLNERNETELLQPMEIARWQIHAGVVVLSGCHSGAGAALPGTGLLGLTRAWLTAGAQSVLASRWATPDEEGDLFHSFYESLSSQPRADSPQALRAAQLAMIQAGGWRGQPRYWGAYFVVGNQ